MEPIQAKRFSAPAPDWEFLRIALGRLAVEVAESAVIGYFEAKPISFCYDDELPRARQASCERATEGSPGSDTR